MAHKEKLDKVVKTTTNSRTYNIAIKMLRERRGEISCSICPYNGGENSTRKDFKGWKTRSKRKKQWKPL